jgi:CheY-like chemotaxis protein
MSIVSVFSGSYCRAEELVQRLLDRTGYHLVSDSDIVQRASQLSSMAGDKLARVFSAKSPVFNAFTRERERSVSALRYALAERLVGDDMVVDGYCSHLIPESMTHVLDVCLIADMKTRISTAATTEGLTEKDAARQIRKQDQDRAAWVMAVANAEDPWLSDLYDILIPTDKTVLEEAVETIAHSLERSILQPTSQSRRAAEDFLIASRAGLALAEKGHHVDVECSSGDVTLTINKRVLMLGRFEDELRAIAEPIEGVRSVSTRVGRDFYQPDIYRRVDLGEPKKILLVDDEREFVQTLSERLELRDVGSAVAYDGESALQMVDDDEPDVMILDLKMPGIDGIEVLRRVRKSHPHVEVIILTGHGSEEDGRTCMELGAFAYLQKPVDIDVLSETLKRAKEKAGTSGPASSRPTGEST